MVKTMKLKLLLLLILAAANASAADLNYIIERNLSLRAGKDNLAGIKTFSAEAELRAHDYNSIYSLQMKDKNKIRLVMTLDSNRSITTFNSDSAWITDIVTGEATNIVKDKVIATKIKISDQFYIYKNVFIDYKERGYNAELYNTIMLNEDSVYIVKLTTNDKTKDNIYVNIHAPSGLEYEIYYGDDPDNRKTGKQVVLKENHFIENIFIPHIVETAVDGKLLSMKIFKNIKINQPISDSVFLYPKFKITADEIIKKHIAAIGGDKKLKKLKNISIQGIMYGVSADTQEDKDTTQVRYYRMFPGMIRIDMIERQDIQKTFVFGDTTGWYKEPTTNNKPNELIKPLLASLKYFMRTYFVFYDDMLFNYKSYGFKPVLVGEVIENGKKYYDIKVKLETGTEYFYFIDSQTFLISKRLNKTLGSENYFSLLYSDYRDAGGYKMPFAFETQFERTSTKIRVTKAEVNSKLGKELFDAKNN
jgi:hypothetical protein